MPDTGFVIVGTGGNYDDGFSTNVWGSPGNITANDFTSATANYLSGVTEDNQILRGSNLGLSLPATVTIDGIEVEIERNTTIGGVGVDRTMRLFGADGTPKGNDGASATQWTNSVAVETYGGASELWGASWSKAEVEDVDFGAGVSADQVSGSNFTFAVDYIAVKVYYSEGVSESTPGDPGELIAGTQGIIRPPAAMIGY